MPNKITFEYTVTLWDDSGNVLIDRRSFRTKCVNQYTAKNRAVKKYPYPYFVELNNTKN